MKGDDFNSIYERNYRRSFLFTKSYVHDDMAAERHDPAEEAVIQLLRTVAWGTGIEHVSGDDQYVNVPVADCIRQPVEEGGKGFVAPAPVEGAPDMPVGRMQYS